MMGLPEQWRGPDDTHQQMEAARERLNKMWRKQGLTEAQIRKKPCNMPQWQFPAVLDLDFTGAYVRPGTSSAWQPSPSRSAGAGASRSAGAVPSRMADLQTGQGGEEQAGEDRRTKNLQNAITAVQKELKAKASIEEQPVSLNNRDWSSLLSCLSGGGIRQSAE